LAGYARHSPTNAQRRQIKTVDLVQEVVIKALIFSLSPAPL
jgi:hypothetical protein